MTFLEFLVSVIDSLAWPTASIVLVLILRDPLRLAMSLLRKAKYGALELEFDEIVEKARDARIYAEVTEKPVADLFDEIGSDKLKELINSHLTRSERLIVVLRYYERMTLKEIGIMLDATEDEVSKMLSAALSKLRDALNS